MKNLSLYVRLYSLLLLVGGGIGYLFSGSWISLIVSLTFAVALFICAKDASTLRGKIGMALVFLLTAFFGYRFAKTQQLPSLVFGLLSLGVLLLQITAARASSNFYKN
jgi:uncharacterized membrane protein (UPF0136 family)